MRSPRYFPSKEDGCFVLGFSVTSENRLCSRASSESSTTKTDPLVRERNPIKASVVGISKR